MLKAGPDSRADSASANQGLVLNRFFEEVDRAPLPHWQQERWEGGGTAHYAHPGLTGNRSVSLALAPGADTPGSPVEREDAAQLPLVVGLYHARFCGESSHITFSDFHFNIHSSGLMPNRAESNPRLSRTP